MWLHVPRLQGSQILGYSVSIGDATDWVQMCTIRTTFGDFGLCDQIALESTTHAITVDGQVSLGEPTLVRSVEGDCN